MQSPPMVTVAVSVRSKEGPFYEKEIACLRPHPGDAILTDSEEFIVREVALVEGEAKVLARADHGSGKRLPKATLVAMGFSLIKQS